MNASTSAKPKSWLGPPKTSIEPQTLYDKLLGVWGNSISVIRLRRSQEVHRFVEGPQSGLSASVKEAGFRASRVYAFRVSGSLLGPYFRNGLFQSLLGIYYDKTVKLYPTRTQV